MVLWRGREARLPSVMSAVRPQQCHLGKPRQLSVGADCRLCSRSPRLDIIFDFNSACCTPNRLKWFLFYYVSFIPSTTQGCRLYILTQGAERMASRWSPKPVGPQSKPLLDDSRSLQHTVPLLNYEIETE